MKNNRKVKKIIELYQIMTAFCFDKLNVTDDLDFMCHYATDKEFKDFQNSDKPEDIWVKVFKRVLKDNTRGTLEIFVDSL